MKNRTNKYPHHRNWSAFMINRSKRNKKKMSGLCCFLILMGIMVSCNSQQSSQRSESIESSHDTKVSDKVILAVFAHPDDELSVGPLLAKYAREGAKVQLVTVTDGRYGTGQTDLKPGDELTALRHEEVDCAAQHMGIEKPIWMGYHDQLKLKGGYFGHVPYIQDLMRDLDSLVTEIEPDVIITWGPDGGSNHMDHRIVGASITQVYLSKTWNKTKALYYVATPSSHIEEEDRKLLRGVADDYLTTQIPFSQEDRENTIRSMRCYKSQFAPELMDSRAEHWRKGNQIVYLRPLIKGTRVSEDIFEEPD